MTERKYSLLYNLDKDLRTICKTLDLLDMVFSGTDELVLEEDRLYALLSIVWDANGSLATVRKALEQDDEEHRTERTVPDPENLTLDEALDGVVSGIDRAKIRVHNVLFDSMDPTFRIGDAIVVDESFDRVAFDGIWYLGWGGGRYVCRAQVLDKGSVALTYDNPKMPTGTIAAKTFETGEVKVFGAVRAHLRRP